MALDSRVERRFSRTFRPPFLAHVNNRANNGDSIKQGFDLAVCAWGER